MNTKLLKYRSATLLLAILLSAIGQLDAATTKAPELDGWDWLLHNLPLVIGFAIVIATGVYLVQFLFLLMKVQQRRIYQAQGIELPKVEKKASLWNRMYQWFTKSVPIEQEEDILLDHNYDGIRELDNSLPPWWVAMFYITIFVGTAYFLYYEYFDYGLTSHEAYEQEMEYAEKIKEKYLEKQANAVNESNVVALDDPQSLAFGKSIYMNNCVACHGQLGEGGVGPNMTDNYWIHGDGDIKSIFKTVKYGVPDKGMIAWSTQMSPSSIHQVSSYIMTLKGTEPPNGKAPQGNLVK